MKKKKFDIITAIFFIFILFSSMVPIINAVDILGNTQTQNIDPIDGHQISLELYNNQGTVLMKVNLLRPLSWIEEMNAVVGAYIHLILTEKGIDDYFLVTDITPCHDISNDGNLVTGLFRSFGPTVTIGFDNSDGIIECTYGHRFFSLDQDYWIPAQDLIIGERISAKDGFVTIASLMFHDEIKEVYNLEVADEHTFFVTYDDILSHNTCNVEGNEFFSKLIDQYIGEGAEGMIFTVKGQPGKVVKVWYANSKVARSYAGGVEARVLDFSSAMRKYNEIVPNSAVEVHDIIDVEQSFIVHLPNSRQKLIPQGSIATIQDRVYKLNVPETFQRQAQELVLKISDQVPQNGRLDFIQFFDETMPGTNEANMMYGITEKIRKPRPIFVEN